MSWLASRAAIALLAMCAMMTPGSVLAAVEIAPKSLGQNNSEHESNERNDPVSLHEGMILRRETRTALWRTTIIHPRRHAPTCGHLPTYTNRSGTGCLGSWLLNDLGAPLRI